MSAAPETLAWQRPVTVGKSHARGDSLSLSHHKRSRLRETRVFISRAGLVSA